MCLPFYARRPCIYERYVGPGCACLFGYGKQVFISTELHCDLSCAICTLAPGRGVFIAPGCNMFSFAEEPVGRPRRPRRDGNLGLLHVSRAEPRRKGKQVLASGGEGSPVPPSHELHWCGCLVKSHEMSVSRGDSLCPELTTGLGTR